MRVLVTGGAGFIGSHIVDALLDAGHDLFVMDDLSSGSRENLPLRAKFLEGDIRNAQRVTEVFREIEPNWVCHQAAQVSVSRSVRNPRFDAEVNVLGLVQLLQAAADSKVERFVFASSGGVLYGDVTKPAPEETPADPISPYGFTKWVGEKYLEFFAKEYGMQTVALRYANVYGPRQNPHGEAGVVAIFCTRLLSGEPATVNGDGKYVRDYVYGEDVARANVAALTVELKDKFRAFNIGTARPADVNELESLVRGHCQAALKDRSSTVQVPPPNYGPPRLGDLRSSLVSYQRAARELNWKPTVDLETGLKKTVEWFAARVVKPTSPTTPT